MLSITPQTRVFVGRDPVDMRGSADALSGQVRRMGLEPQDGSLYVFLSRRRHLLGVLAFDGSGWCLFRKRLERGTFELPDLPEGARRVAVDGRVLTAMLTNLQLGEPRRRWYDYDAPVPRRPGAAARQLTQRTCWKGPTGWHSYASGSGSTLKRAGRRLSWA